MPPLTSDSGFIIRPCDSVEDFQQCLDLQRETWQFSELDITPLRIYIISSRAGGPTYGAFDRTGRLVAFSHMYAMWEGLRRSFYSHMLAVRPEMRDHGFGRLLKLEQRKIALGLGIPRIVWTFDPLQSRNAFFNLEKLGAITNRYEVNYYGQSSSLLHRGLDTDRLFVEWWVASRRVERRTAGIRPPLKVAGRIEIPEDIGAVKARSMEEAIEWQQKIRKQFLDAFRNGLHCAGLERAPEQKRSYYLLVEDWQDED